MQMQLTDLEHKDLAKERRLILENGNVITFKCKDPYGFWTVHYDKGGMPKNLQGQYTAFEYAYADVKKYLSTKFNDVTQEQFTEGSKQPPPEKPKFQYKSTPPSS